MVYSNLHAGAKGRTILLALWFFFFLLNGGIIVFIYLQGWIGRDNLWAGLQQWNTAYAPYIGAITLFYWGKNRQAEQDNQGKTAFYLALTCSLL